ncbi:MAG: hypothetical protein WCY25_08890 [Moheibacter sp.]
MKTYAYFIACLISIQGFAQNIEFENHRVNYKLSHEILRMDNEEDLGMVGIGADLFIFDKFPNLYVTLNSYSALTGERPGLISFGMGVGYLQSLFDTPLELDAGIFVGGGGGGGAPDGGGLITRGHVNLAYNFNQFSLFAGYSRMDFPTGSMGGNNLNFGLSIHSFFDTAKKSPETNSETVTESMNRSRFRVSLLGMRYMDFAKGPFPPGSHSKADNIQLVGVEVDKFLSRNFYAALKLNGAVTGGIDGYMNYLIGFGYEQPLGTDKLTLDAQILGGPSGGGGIDSGGGATLQAGIGLRAHLGNEFEIKASAGQSYAPGGTFSGTFLEFGLSKNFRFLYPKDKTANVYSLQKGDKLHGFGLELLNRTYFSPDKRDKNDRPYDKIFNLIGFQASKDLGKNFHALGSTYWAYQGSYGAYAEGWLGLRYAYPFANTWRAYAQFLGGAAGGGGIDLGSGLAFQYGLGIEKAISNHWGLSLSAGKMQGFKGNFNPAFIDFGVKYSFLQVSK